MAEILGGHSQNENMEDLDLIISKLFSHVSTVVNQISNVENRITNLMGDMIHRESLPLVLRKRLMYQRALSC